MVKKLTYVSALVLLVAAAVTTWVFTPASRASASAAGIEFPTFPIGDARVVRVTSDGGGDATGAYDNDADRQRRRLDQVRDWCLLTVIAASNLPAKEINQVTYDLPSVREETLRRITSFEYGETRARVISDRDVVALVPRGEPKVRDEQFGHIADEQRKNLGELPATVHVFEYELGANGDTATIRRLPPIPGADLFTPRYGYYERTVTSRDDLAALLEQIDDLVMARRSGEGVVLGGRHLMASPYRKIGLEEVATLWRGQRGLPEYQGVGFSLDPRLDVATAAARFDTDFASPLMRDYLVDAGQVRKAREILASPAAKTPEQKAEQAFAFIQALVEACASSVSPKPCLKTMGSGAFDSSYQVARYEGNNLAGTEVGMVLFYTDLLMKLWSFDFERTAPRTVSGFPVQPEMRLSQIYRGDVERAPDTRYWLEPLDRAYQIADQRETILFARNATRVSARAHSFIAGRDEDFDPNVFTRVLIDWWNDHFEEIAAYEPQYQRLNEITKWGVVIAWLDLEQELASLDFLSDSAKNPIQVSRNHRLPAWKDRHLDELTFKPWNTIQFDRPEQARAEYESLELLHSRAIPYFDGPIAFQGGVSLSSRATVASRAAASGELRGLSATARRAGVDARLTNLTAGRLRTLDATTYEFKNYSQQAVSMLARAKPSARLKNAFGEIENVGFDRTVRRSADGLLVHTRADANNAARLNGELGELRIFRNAGEYNVHWQSRDLDLGHAVARRMSTAGDPSLILASERNVEVPISLGADRGFLVKVRDSETWIRLTPAKVDSRAIAEGYHARVAGVGPNARTYDVAWVDEATARAQLDPDGYLRVASNGTASEPVKISCCTRAPPPAAVEGRLQAAGEEIRIAVDASGARYVRVSDLPASVRSDLATLTGAPRRLEAADRQLARSLERGEYRQAARQLAIDRVEYQARLNRIIEAELRVQRALDEQAALTHLDEAMRAFGQTPELSAHKAALQVASGDPEGAAASLNAARGTTAGKADRIVDEINAVVATRAPTAAQAADRVRVAQWVRWRDLPNRSGEIVVDGRGGRLALELRATRLPRNRIVQSADVEAALADRNAVIYIRDTPAMSNLDVFTAPGRQSLHQLVEGRRVTVLELELNDVARFRPAALHDVSRQSTYRLTRPKSLAQSGVRVVHPRNAPNVDDDDDDEDGVAGRRVYVVEAAM